ncbi:Crp/Fnr family transcriptional regulator [Amphritea sp. 1_MG-2023]|uniref:Crp/Fnr family transcriptional regulator n=1 Tax=Amphritea sp. 1_MG-2023 TaxID=3062670 RepID=UPI0026E415F0|nr:Crp/Fnr family transcriptional regulator [Amphritea sp. 1_MG-2023]MDO6565304.1 Crp/Fnr family transcriptional regulator [Amphritea sp. 1_MG-2023]
MNDIRQLTQPFSLLQQLDEAGLAILSQAKRVDLPAGQVVFQQGNVCDHFIIVTSGTVKVLGRNANGRELILYRIEHQGTCVLTTSCLLGGEAYPAEGITETAVTAFLLPLSGFQRAMTDSTGLRQFIFDSYGERLAKLITLVQEIAFERIETRLARYLIEQVGPSSVLLRSHQEIADELGTAREVVSRQLKLFEQKEWLALSRNQVLFLNKSAVRNAARS